MVENRSNEITALITKFVTAVTNMKLYPHSHPEVLIAVDRFYSSILELFEHTPELTFFLIDDDIIAFEKPLPNPGFTGDTFMKILRDKGIERITFLKGLPKSQLYKFIGDLAISSRHSISADSHVKLGKVVFNGLPEAGEQVQIEKPADFLAFNYKAAAELKKMYLEIRGDKIPDTTRAKEIVAEFIKIYNHSINPLEILAQIKSEDEYIYVHITNVALLTICLADYLGFSGNILQEIGVAALLHDVGKMFIPAEILKKPGTLTAEEWAVIETHTLKGAQYISYHKNVPKLTIIAALEHHIKYNGSGYPQITDDWEPNIASQMICIADVYDALRSKRPYQEPKSYDQIKTILQEGRGSIFNPALVDNFLAMIERQYTTELEINPSQK